jgi:methyl-accepting chemotaxis protein
VLEKTKTIIHAIIAFLLGILGFCIGRKLTRSKTNDDEPDTSGVESAISAAATNVQDTASELTECAGAATSVTDGIKQSQEQAQSIGEHIQQSSDIVGTVISDLDADSGSFARISELITELESRVDESDEKLKD